MSLLNKYVRPVYSACMQASKHLSKQRDKLKLYQIKFPIIIIDNIEYMYLYKKNNNNKTVGRNQGRALS